MEDCCICYESTKCEDFIKIKECTHNMCKLCMEKHIHRNMNKCPVCRIEFDINEKAHELGIQLYTDIDELLRTFLSDDIDLIIDTLLLTQINLISLDLLYQNE